MSYYASFNDVFLPTSWLSMQSHILHHLARTLDLSCRSGLFPLDCEAYPPQSDSQRTSIGIRSLNGSVTLVGPSPIRALYLQYSAFLRLASKAISWEYQLSPVRLAFHPYPQLIP